MLSQGTKVGVYEVVALIGAGGMGEVYRARDTRLNRDVAIKVLSEAFAKDAERMSRFEREAQVLAGLNHSNIAAIYGIEESGPVRALIMELVEGPTLAERIAGGAIPVDEALPIARQVADAVEYAHDKNVIHRDLKPANIKVTAEGTVKVLDFGLAKAMSEEVSEGDMSNSPTLSMAATRQGVILGTAAYMSPEQAKGKTVDRRTDVWAFGAVLYETLTGKQAFAGEDITEVLAAVVKSEPDWSCLPQNTPPAIRNLLRRCLEKNARRRLGHVSEARILLEDVLSGAAPAEPVTAAPRDSRERLVWAAGLVLAVGALGALSFVHLREAPPHEQMLRYTVAAPETSKVESFAISSDGRTLVIAAVVNGKRQLWLRPMDALQTQPMASTEDATYPFWSPDSRYIGFFAQGKLKKVAASGGPAQSLCDAANANGGSWSRDDVIVFAPGTAGSSIQRVAAEGGVPVDVTKIKGNLMHPDFLPDGRHFLYLVVGTATEVNGVYVSSLDGKENRRVLADLSGIVFAPPSRSDPSGHILFVRENTLMAEPFDAASAQLSGDAFPVAEGVSLVNISYLPATVSENGVLLYEAGGTAGAGVENQMGWYDRTGKFLGPVGKPGDVLDPALSPDEKSIVFRRLTAAGSDLWVRDLSRGTETRFTSDGSLNLAPFWSPKGDRIVFTSNRKDGLLGLYQKAASGSGRDEPLLQNSINTLSSQWSRDGRFIVYFEVDPKNKRDLWVLPVEVAATDRKPIPFLRTEFDELFGQLSPDSHWMAFTSDRSGRREVYVRPFPPGEGEWTISLAGGQGPRWRGDGKELFYAAADGKVMAVPVEATA